jgi:hypothetical protein
MLVAVAVQSVQVQQEVQVVLEVVVLVGVTVLAQARLVQQTLALAVVVLMEQLRFILAPTVVQVL